MRGPLQTNGNGGDASPGSTAWVVKLLTHLGLYAIWRVCSAWAGRRRGAARAHAGADVATTAPKPGIRAQLLEQLQQANVLLEDLVYELEQRREMYDKMLAPPPAPAQPPPPP